MTSNEKVFSLLKNTFNKAINSLSSAYQGTSLTDVFITVDKDSGEVTFYDDEENNIAKVVIEEWSDDNVSDTTITSTLKNIVEKLNNEDAFISLDLYYPFSISYADENMLVVEELITIDDESIVQIDNDLLAKFDKEFDDFLDKLLKE